MSQAHPEQFIQRGSHYRTLEKAGALFEERFNCACATQYENNESKEQHQIENLGLIDLSSFPRTGFKGKEAIQWTKSLGLNIGDANNLSYTQENGALIARLADSEIIILNDLYTEEDQCIELEKRYDLERPTKCYPVPRRDSSTWFMITGKQAIGMFAKICGIDLRLHKFQNGSIAQTSVARINGIIIRKDLKNLVTFHFLFDSASTEYMWSSLMDAFQEFNGAPVGINALLKL